MIWDHEAVLQAVTGACMVALGISLIPCVYRLLRGPTLPDRVVALDLLAFLAIGIIAVFAMASNRPVLLSVCIVMALVLFLGTSAFAMYLERRARP